MAGGGRSRGQCPAAAAQCRHDLAQASGWRAFMQQIALVVAMMPLSVLTAS